MRMAAPDAAGIAGSIIEPLPYDVAYVDTDAGGIVYHATYAAMAERSRNHVLRMLGLPVAEMKERFGVLFVVREIRAIYHRPALVGDALTLWSGIVTSTPVRALWRTTVMGHGIEGIEEIRDENLPSEIEIAPPPTADKTALVSSSDLSVPEAPVIPLTSAPAAEPTPAGNCGYRVTDLSTFKAEPDLFYEFAYRDTLRGMIEAVMDAESPLPADVLAQRIARAHGWLRTGARIRERIDLHLRGYDTTNESSGVFIWKKGHIVDVLRYRPSANEESRRAIADISLAELASVVIDNRDLLDMPDPPRDMARLLGVERLAATARARLDEAIAHARVHMAGQERTS